MKNLFFLVALMFLLNSCDKNYETEKITSHVLVSVKKDGNRTLIQAETEKEYPTLGYQIMYCDQLRSNEIYIEFKKVKYPLSAFTAIGPGTCTIDFGILEYGDYELTFKLNGEKISGTLSIGATNELIINSGGNVELK